MNEPCVISWSLYPRYKMTGKHMEPVVVEAARRVMWSNGVIDLTTISAADYHKATGCERDSICAAPLLLAACESFVATYLRDTPEAVLAAYQQAYAAIAASKGE